MILDFARLSLAIALTSLTLFSSVVAVRCHKPAPAFSRRVMEEKFGVATKCSNTVENVACFKIKDVFVQAQFNSSDYAEIIRLSTGCKGLRSLMDAAMQVAPKSSRGKFRTRIAAGGRSCQPTYVEQYECLTMEYAEELCLGCAPAYIKIILKKIP
jgi:hypothetical protein